MHLEAHLKISQSCQVPFTKILENGKCLKIAPEKPKIYGKVETGLYQITQLEPPNTSAIPIIPPTHE